MREAIGGYLLRALAIVLIIAVAFGIFAARYRECRSHGFSVFYCVTQ